MAKSTVKKVSAKSGSKKTEASNATDAMDNAGVETQVVQRRNAAFKISMTAVYNNDDMSADDISDGVFQAMTRVGKGLAILHVDSVKQVAKPEDVIAKILAEVSEQSSDAMTSKTGENGKEFVAVNGKAKAKGRKKNEL